MECRDTQISCIAAKSLAGPLEACRPQEGLKSRSAQAPRSTRQGHQARTPQGGLHPRRKNPGEIVRADDDDSGAGGRPRDLTKVMKKPEEGLTT
jgi:hypothetical protein